MHKEQVQPTLKEAQQVENSSPSKVVFNPSALHGLAGNELKGSKSDVEIDTGCRVATAEDKAVKSIDATKKMAFIDYDGSMEKKKKKMTIKEKRRLKKEKSGSGG